MRSPAAAVPAVQVAVLGGGNGISVVLRGLAEAARAGTSIVITAVVATGDDGGSSGRLRRQRGGLPPGDLRSCLLALTPDDSRPFAALFAHRYQGSGDLAGHVLGNLILSALAEREGDYIRALDVAAGMLGACGRVLPASREAVRLEGECRDGCRISGESTIGRAHSIERIWLEPQDAAIAPGVAEAIGAADLVVIGPGSLFTSILPVLLVPGVASAVRASRGRRILIANLMSQPGETLGMDLGAHLEALDRHVGPHLVQEVLVHEGALQADRLEPYASQHAAPVTASSGQGRVERLVRAHLVTDSGKIRHDGALLAALLLAMHSQDPPRRRSIVTGGSLSPAQTGLGKRA